jgi:hypothetical protein
MNKKENKCCEQHDKGEKRRDCDREGTRRMQETDSLRRRDEKEGCKKQ